MSKLEMLINDFNKQYKEEIIVKGKIRRESEKIPFSSPRANYILYGGIPRGRIIEFAGEENGGKTTSALDIVANAQRLFKAEWQAEIDELKQLKGKPSKEQLARLETLQNGSPRRVLYADCENTLDEDWATLLGVNMDNLIVIRPMSQTAEQIFEIILQFIETAEIGLVVIDSLGVMLSAQAFEKSMEEKTYGGIASSLTLFSKKAEMLCAKTNCTLIGINQMREDMSNPYGGTKTTGGRGWRHNCSVRLLFSKGVYIDRDGHDLKRSAETPSGNLVMIHIAKTKVCKPDRRLGFYTLRYDTGIDVLADTIDMAIKDGIIVQAGSWFQIVDGDGNIRMNGKEQMKFQGKANLMKFLQGNGAVFDEIKHILG